MCCMLEGL